MSSKRKKVAKKGNKDEVLNFVSLPRGRGRNGEGQPTRHGKDLSVRSFLRTKPYLKYRNESQKQFVEKMQKNEMIFCCGPAGTGKSMLTVYKALMMLYDETSPYEKMIIIKPAVEAEEKLGFLPGDEKEKISVYVKSSLDLIDKLVGQKVREDLVEFGFIECRSIAYMRGDNIDNSILIVEEAQNMTRGQMKLLLTRIGENSKFIISGDLEQSDRFRDTKLSGLSEAFNLFQDVKGIAFHQFTMKEVVRNPLVGKIINAYNGFADTTKVDNEIEEELKTEDTPKKSPMFLED